jgi:tRNA threonylcarbamoyladenosine biosynthesis protein TsaB
MLLAIDTSTAQASVALYQDAVLAETTWHAGMDHTRHLLPQIQALLNVLGRSIDAVTALGVGLGPGSFNGLRVGIATAKAIAEARGLPIVGVDTLQAMAYQFRTIDRPIRPLFDAARGEVATGLYRAGNELFATLEAPRIASLTDALDASPPGTFFCGELKPAWVAEIIQRHGEGAIRGNLLARPAENARRAGYLAELAWQELQAGLTSDLATLQPLYLRRPPISGTAHPVGSAAT